MRSVFHLTVLSHRRDTVTNRFSIGVTDSNSMTDCLAFIVQPVSSSAGPCTIDQYAITSRDWSGVNIVRAPA